MRHLDLSFEGRRLSDRDQPENGIRPHGGYRGSKRHPMCHFSYDKGREFHHKMEEEIERLILSNELALQGTSPSWSLAVHREPSYTDESPLISNNYLAASKVAASNGVTLHNRPSLLPPKKGFKPQKRETTQFYRPNSTHQYLSATELKNASEGDVNPLYGRPTRTTLLRARQRCTSAPTNNQVKRRESDPKIDDYRSCYSVPTNTENLQLDKDGETLHSFLTGARYNRAHCLDARSVDHSGVYMPRNNTAMGCFFTGPKGHEYLKEFEATTPRSESMPSPRLPLPVSPKRRRPTTAPGHGDRGNRPVTVHPSVTPPSPSQGRRQAWAITANGPSSSRYKTLNVIGCRLPIGMGKEMALRLPNLQPISSSRKPLEETYRGYQPPPTPTSLQQPSQDAPTDRRLEAGRADHLQEFEILGRDDMVVGTPVTQVVVKSNASDEGKTRKVEKDEVVDDEELEKEEMVAGDERENEEKVEEEVKESKETEDEEELREENIVVDETVKEDEKEDEKVDENLEEEGIKAEEKKEENVENVENDNIDENERVEDGYGDDEEKEAAEDEVDEEKKEKEEEDEEEKEENLQKEVRFFITEKDREEVENGVDEENIVEEEMVNEKEEEGNKGEIVEKEGLEKERNDEEKFEENIEENEEETRNDNEGNFDSEHQENS